MALARAGLNIKVSGPAQPLLSVASTTPELIQCAIFCSNGETRLFKVCHAEREYNGVNNAHSLALEAPRATCLLE
jgi:hypothetical protein